MSQELLVLTATFTSLLISSIAGYGGSLVLVPAMGAILGPKEGIAFAALLLGWNNVFKVIAYRRTLALRQGWPLLVVTAVGVWFGASLLISASDDLIIWAVIATTVATLIVELRADERLLRASRHAALPTMAASAVLSGVSGSSGPLKGISVRSLGLPRLEHVGLASSVSLVADALKVELFHTAGLFEGVDLTTMLIAIPVMPIGAWMGRSVNRRVDENAFRWIFWSVVGGYTLRMAGLWF
ncbi:MAG: sulfite exporter TauE/SafE family protein [Mycobacterium sp.]